MVRCLFHSSYSINVLLSTSTKEAIAYEGEFNGNVNSAQFKINA